MLRVSFSKYKVKRLPERPRRKWENNIIAHLTKIWFIRVKWNNLTRNGIMAATCEHVNGPSGYIKWQRVY